jgi:hypothetical protein
MIFRKYLPDMLAARLSHSYRKNDLLESTPPFLSVSTVTLSCHTWLLLMSFHEFIWSRTQGKILSQEEAKHVDTVGVTGSNPVSRTIPAGCDSP